MQVEAFTHIDPHQFFNLHQPADVGTHRLDTQVSGLAISNDFSGRFNVTTTEGDTITLTADRETDFRADTYQSRLQADHAAVSVGAKTTHVAGHRDFGVSVDGHLNEQELRDLDKLFQNISQVFRRFVEGPAENAQVQTTKLAERFSELGTLSSLNLSVEIVRSVTVVSASGSTPGGAPETAAAIPLASNGTTAPTPSPDSPDARHLTVPVKDAQLAALISQVFDALKEAETELHQFKKHLPDFFEKLQEDLIKELRSERAHKADDPAPDRQTGSDQVPSSANNGVLLAYQAVSHTSVSLSIHS